MRITKWIILKLFWHVAYSGTEGGCGLLSTQVCSLQINGFCIWSFGTLRHSQWVISYFLRHVFKIRTSDFSLNSFCPFVWKARKAYLMFINQRAACITFFKNNLKFIKELFFIMVRRLHSTPAPFPNLEFCHYEYFDMCHVRLGICTSTTTKVMW